MTKIETLKKRFENELASFVTDLKGETPARIIEQAEMLVVMRAINSHIHDGGLSADDKLDYYLNLDSPLKSIAEYIIDTGDVISTNNIDYAIYEIVDQGIYDI